MQITMPTMTPTDNETTLFIIKFVVVIVVGSPNIVEEMIDTVASKIVVFGVVKTVNGVTSNDAVIDKS
jgi:hypothetical protein